MTSVDALRILLVEDNPGDVRLTQEVLRESKMRLEMDVASDGEEALARLRAAVSGDGVPRPDLILLDLNLPKKGGREVLAEIKNDPELRQIPVVVLSSSAADADVMGTYDLNANCYVSKPVGLEEFQKVVRAIEDFWFTIVRLPRRSS